MCLKYRKLIGKIGDLEVGQVKSAAERIMHTGDVDKKNVFIYGGSHGGFISAFLLGLYPVSDRFSFLF